MLLPAIHLHQTVVVQSREPRDGRFDVLVRPEGFAAGMERWTLDRIKQAIADGDAVTEKES